MRTMPNDVNEKRNTMAAAAARAGARSGATISRNRRQGLAPSVAAASDMRGSRFVQKVPTTRTTTATLKKAWATRMGAQPRSSRPGRIARKARATTTVGRTKGTSTTALTTFRPGKR
jgi:hypothetical protein